MAQDFLLLAGTCATQVSLILDAYVVPRTPYGVQSTSYVGCVLDP